ncbi:unnamed protein product [Zymoseptoria tritici ST99CH_3D1]|nr:unnamed protein product [Zymoseptoria tritici ST99CH_3D1]
MSANTSALMTARLHRDSQGNITYYRTPITQRDPADTMLLGQAVEAEQTAFAYMRASVHVMREALEKKKIGPKALEKAKLNSRQLAATGELLHKLGNVIVIGTSVPFDYMRVDPREKALWTDGEIEAMIADIKELNRNVTAAEAEAEEKEVLM